MVSRRLGINRTDHRLLDLIDQHGPVPAGELARLAGLSPAAITTAVDRLEQAGLARRGRHRDDRRCVLVAATERARRGCGACYGPLAAEAQALTERFSEDQLRAIAEFLRRATELIERRAGELRAETRPAPEPAGRPPR